MISNKKCVMKLILICSLVCLFSSLFSGPVDLGIDVFISEGHLEKLKGKNIGLITNQTGVNKKLIPTADLLIQEAKEYTIVALFSPEHGFSGSFYANEKVEDGLTNHRIPLHSLFGQTRRPTDEMLKGIDVLIYDIQDIGVRSYTFATTLFYVMEEAVKRKIEVIVLDRPNPLNGLTIDGGMLEDKWRSFIGYINVPYCHGMTIGELAQFFNEEYDIGCSLKVIPMRGWKRSMSFKETGLTWIPTSPHIPEEDSPLFYASTGILGELDLVNIGVGYTLPFKVIGAPWIDADLLAQGLNKERMPGVYFVPFHYKPFYGSLKGQECHGVLIRITDVKKYHPVSVGYLLIGTLKNLYPNEVKKKLDKINGSKKKLFCQANGNEEIYQLFYKESRISWKMIGYQQKERKQFKERRKKHLIY